MGERRLEFKSEMTESWFNDVNEIMDDEKINELLDEVKRKANDQCCFGGFHYDISYRYKTSKDAEEMAKKIQDKISNAPSSSVTFERGAADLEATPTEFLEGLDSREDLLLKILNKLQDDNVHSVGIWGMGAIGKTTLAKEVKKKASTLFYRIVMIEISEVPNIDGIQEQIAESIGLSLNGYTTTALRAERLHARLKQVKAKGTTNEKGRKTLIILDNIWKILDYGEVGIPFEQTKECCCNILFTSRKQDVCRGMGVEEKNIMQIPLLSKKDAKHLFNTRVGEKDASADYITVEDRLLRKCGGLPLAIIASANAVKGKSLLMWDRFANELESCEPAYGFHETYTILETSYKFIYNEGKKKFFLFACLFPLGSKILIDEMMRYGIGLCLFQYVNKLSDAMDLAKSWADELRSSSLLLEDESEEYVKIHDVVRESAISFAAKDGQKMMVDAAPRWLCKETWEKYTAISLSSVNDYNFIRELKSNKLGVLRLEGDYMVEPYCFEDDFFEGMINLKVLVLQNIKFQPGLPKSIATLKNLKTLMLEECELGDIKLVGGLESLLVLSFKKSSMEELPEQIGNLGNLRMLDLRRCSIMKSRISAGIIARLSRLEGLFLCDYFKGWLDIEIGVTEWTDVEAGLSDASIAQNDVQSLASVAELNCLSYLNVLEIHIPRSTQLPNSMQFVKNLNEFRIYMSEDIPPLPQYSRVLLIHDTKQVLRHTWLEVLPRKTEVLGLNGISGLKCLAQESNLDDFNCLKYLRLEDCNDMQYVITTNRVIGTPAFPNLESLFLSSMKNLKIIFDVVTAPGIFSNLRDVSLISLDGLEMYALPMNVAQQLTSLEVKDCKNLIFLFLVNGSNGEDESCTTVLPFLKKLSLNKLPKLCNLLGEANYSPASDHSQVCHHLLHRKILLPSLEKLWLNKLYFRELGDSAPNDNDPYFESLGKLNYVDIESCDKVESLCLPAVAAHLLQLESLYIRDCTNMNQLLTQETDEGSLKRCNIFPKLKTLSLYDLDNLKSFYGGTHQLRFQALENLKMEKLPRMISVGLSGNSTAFFNEKIEFPCLECLDIYSVRHQVYEVKELWRPLVAEGFPQLRKMVLEQAMGLMLIPAIAFEELSTLELRGCDTKFAFSTSTPSGEESFVLMQNQMPKFENLVLKDNKFMEGLFDNDLMELRNENCAAVRKICGQLRLLELGAMQNFKLIPLHLFKNLRSLDLEELKCECVFTSDLVTKGIAQLLPLLEAIRIIECDALKIVLDDDSGAAEDISPQVIEFPRLKSIKLRNLKEARHFNHEHKSTLHFPCLEDLCITHSNFQSMFSGTVIAPKLTNMSLVECRAMMQVFSAVELPSLKSLEINSCPDLQSFSVGPLAAPLLDQVSFDEDNYPMNHIDQTNHPINNFLRTKYKERMGEEDDWWF